MNLFHSKLGAILIVLSVFMVSCEIKLQPIEFGKDQCSFCKMNIVDKTHAAQYVTSKGKQYKFDAIECMVNDLIENGNKKRAITVVSDYKNPETMTEAISATYLISKKIKSPMGANLSAFSAKEEAIRLQNEYGGDIYTWETLYQKFSD